MLERDDGQALVEYALIIMLIATVAFATLQLIGISLDAALDEVVTDLSL
jgi:Flp pilus assembly pilin Flp